MSTPANFKVCPKCNAALSLAATECSVCHTSFLPHASNPREFYPRPAPQPEKASQGAWTVALLLAVFLGPFGIHRFYMGYTSQGVAMLFLTIAGLTTLCMGVGAFFLLATGIWALVDMILICCNGIPLADGRRLR
jgi:TM2 domain-containing membrane protein YozV/ribosomal protein L40E